MVRDIIQAPDPRLLQKSEPVVVGRTALGDLFGDLIDTRVKYKAYALSAPQIGVHLRVVAVSPQHFHGFRLLINPELIELAGDVVEGDEGCMSIDWGKTVFKVRRHRFARVRFLTKNAVEATAKTADIVTRIICHEIDHLDGKLIGANLG